MQRFFNPRSSATIIEGGSGGESGNNFEGAGETGNRKEENMELRGEVGKKKEELQQQKEQSRELRVEVGKKSEEMQQQKEEIGGLQGRLESRDAEIENLKKEIAKQNKEHIEIGGLEKQKQKQEISDAKIIATFTIVGGGKAASTTSYAISMDGSLWVAGFNENGQLGTGKRKSLNEWERITTEGLSGHAVKVAVNSSH
jgi:hypothetical protein